MSSPPEGLSLPALLAAHLPSYHERLRRDDMASVVRLRWCVGGRASACSASRGGQATFCRHMVVQGSAHHCPLCALQVR